MELNSSFNCIKGNNTRSADRKCKSGVSSGFNYEKRYTYRLGHKSGVSSGFKCKKGNGRTIWDTKMEWI